MLNETVRKRMIFTEFNDALIEQIDYSIFHPKSSSGHTQCCYPKCVWAVVVWTDSVPTVWAAVKGVPHGFEH